MHYEISKYVYSKNSNHRKWPLPGTRRTHLVCQWDGRGGVSVDVARVKRAAIVKDCFHPTISGVLHEGMLCCVDHCQRRQFEGGTDFLELVLCCLPVVTAKYERRAKRRKYFWRSLLAYKFRLPSNGFFEPKCHIGIVLMCRHDIKLVGAMFRKGAPFFTYEPFSCVLKPPVTYYMFDSAF